MDEVLYERGFSQPYLRYLNPNESLYALRVVHKGACGNHLGARSLVYMMVRVGYYWSSMQVDVKTYVKAYDKCQRYSNIPRQPLESILHQWQPLGPLHSGDLTFMVPSPWGQDR